MSLRKPQALPTDNSDTGEYARRFARALGSAYQAPDGSANAQDALTWGEALLSAQGANKTALDQAFVDSATDLLPYHEAQRGLSLETSLTDAERQDRLTAKVRANFSASPQDILAAVRVYDPTAQLYETLAEEAVAAGEPRNVYQIGLTVNVSVYDDPRKFKELNALLRQMEQTGYRIYLASGRGFYTDGYLGSRTDDTLLGS
jgi:hypothetical protein